VSVCYSKASLQCDISRAFLAFPNLHAKGRASNAFIFRLGIQRG
jgi:hypothetical protein